MASAANNSSTTVGGTTHTQAGRNSIRQTRTNPSRTSKTVARSFSLYGHSSVADAPPTPAVPHGFFPALTHFTDAITALPREFRRHNSLLKEVDAKAWALEENLQQLLSVASESDPVHCPPNPAPIVDGVVREYAVPQDATQPAESQDSKDRRILFDRIRHTLSDLMMTADEKNHVITNANDELDHQLYRLDSIYPYISGEVSDEARLGSLTHWAYSNRTNVKATTTNERPRREAATATSHLVQALHEAEAASRSEARREAVMARKQRRNQAESDFDETRNGAARKGTVAKARAAAAEPADASVTGGAVPTKRRKVEKPTPVQIGSAAMERSVSSVTNTGRTVSKDGTGNEAKKRARAPNALATAGRKRNNTVTSNAGSPSAVSSPLVGTFNPPKGASSPGPNGANRPPPSRAQQSTGPASVRQRPPSSASNRGNNNNKSLDSKTTTSKEATPQVAVADSSRQAETEDENSDTKTNLAVPKDDIPDTRVLENANVAEKALPTISTTVSTKGRSSKNSTPVVSTFPESQSRARASRNNDPAPAKRSHKKSGSVSTATYKPRVVATEDEESSREGDDEDDEGEPRYCYCNEVSFGEMVACDNDACAREWFHLSCVGLTKPPGKNVKWYCNECKEAMRRGRAGGR